MQLLGENTLYSHKEHYTRGLCTGHNGYLIQMKNHSSSSYQTYCPVGHNHHRRSVNRQQNLKCVGIGRKETKLLLFTHAVSS